MTDEAEAAKLVRLIVEHQPCVALTGAGVSTVNHEPESRVAKMG